MKPKARSQPKQRKRSRIGLPVWVAVPAAALLLLAGILLFASRPVESAGGKLTADRATHDFGRVAISGGMVTTKFALTVQGSPTVTNLFTN